MTAFLFFVIVSLCLIASVSVSNIRKDIEELRTRVNKLERIKSIDASRRALSMHGDK